MGKESVLICARLWFSASLQCGMLRPPSECTLDPLGFVMTLARSISVIVLWHERILMPHGGERKSQGPTLQRGPGSQLLTLNVPRQVTRRYS